MKLSEKAELFALRMLGAQPDKKNLAIAGRNRGFITFKRVFVQKRT